LTLAGPGTLYLSVDPGAVGYAGCRLAATVILDPEGRSDPFVLGRVIRVPRLERFTLTTEKITDSGYSGILEGRDLDVIEKAGWDAQHGMPIESIPTPLPDDSSRQKLFIALSPTAPGLSRSKPGTSRIHGHHRWRLRRESAYCFLSRP
jgi:hypothetical protein